MKIPNKVILALGIVLAVSKLFGQNFNVLHNFTNIPDGCNPQAGLILNGNTLFGTTYYGGASGNGTLFRINSDGSDYSVIYNFSAFGKFMTNTDGANPQANLALSGDTLYGTTSHGGYLNLGSSVAAPGTIFSVNTNGTNFLVLKYISGRQAGLVLNSNTLYGTTYGTGYPGTGSLFAMNTNGTGFTNLNSFSGLQPRASMVFIGDTLFGTTYGGNSIANNYGSIFSIKADNTGFTNLIGFSYQSGTNGGQPVADLILNEKTLFGTTSAGSGDSSGGTVFKINTNGADFVILKKFINNIYAHDGSIPEAGLALKGSTLYGTTGSGGSNGIGTIFRVNTDGSGYSVLYNFTFGSGAIPMADLVLGDNALYGTTQRGGSSGFGVVFSLKLPPPSLQITNDNNLPIIFWVDDGQNHILQATTNLVIEDWSNVSALNWTNNSNGALQIGYQVVNPIVSPAVFFRLQ